MISNRRDKIDDVVRQLEGSLKKTRNPKEVVAMLNDYLDTVLNHIVKGGFFHTKGGLYASREVPFDFRTYVFPRLVLVKYWNLLDDRDRGLLIGRYEHMDRFIGAAEVAAFSGDDKSRQQSK